MNFRFLIHKIDFLLLTALVLVVTLTGCKSQAAPKRPPTAVTVLTIEKQTVPAIFEYVAVAESSHLVEIRARVEGYLDKIAYKEGSLVNQNDLLFEIDPRPFQAALDQAKAQEEQQAAFLWQAERALERYRPLYEKKAASLRDLDNATAQALAAQASVNAAKAQVIQAELNLSYTSINSPITGLTNQAKFREGALVGPGSEQSLLTTIYVLDPIWVNFNISEGDLLKYRTEVAKGQLKFPANNDFEIEVVLSDGSLMPSKGKINFLDPSLQQSTGSMFVRSILPNPKKMLMPGQFARARIIGAEYPEAIIVPQRSVLQGKNGLFVYVVDKDNKVFMEPVITGDWVDNDWIIHSGLKVGDRVVIDGVNKIVPGMIVETSPVKGSSA